MIPDLAGFALAVQGVICAAAGVAYWKVHGESKFVKSTQEEMDAFRGKLLRAFSVSLVSKLEPILTLPTSVEIKKIIIPGTDYDVQQAKITTIGAENLLNAVRDVVKSDLSIWQALRSLDHASTCASYCLKQLRQVIVIVLVASGVFALVATADKYAIFRIEHTWAHIAGLMVVVFLLGVGACAAIRITLSVNRFETLKERHADIS